MGVGDTADILSQVTGEVGGVSVEGPTNQEAAARSHVTAHSSSTNRKPPRHWHLRNQ